LNSLKQLWTYPLKQLGTQPNGYFSDWNLLILIKIRFKIVISIKESKYKIRFTNPYIKFTNATTPKHNLFFQILTLEAFHKMAQDRDKKNTKK
jgi:hypothetical protein